LTPRGRFITLEGGEGTGKSTQSARLAGWLRGQGIDVIETREPGGSPGAESLRAVLLDTEPDAWDAITEALIITAARRDHLKQTIKPALQRGTWVICDRFADSTTAYQGHGHGLDMAALEMLYDLAAGPFAPDLTLILDMDPGAALARTEVRGSGNRFERMGPAFHHRVHLGFLDIASREPDRCELVSADGTPDDVTARLQGVMVRHMAAWADAEATIDEEDPDHAC